MLVFIIVCILIVGIVMLIVNFLVPFFEERNYIKLELSRCYDIDEYKYWKRMQKKLYRKYFPYLKYFIK